MSLTDTTVRHTNTPTNIKQNIPIENILKYATKQKHDKYDGLAKNEDADFSAYGSMSQEFSNFINSMASSFYDITPPETATMTKKQLVKQIKT